MIELNKIGFTVSQDADWKNYSVGSYTSYYIRPLSLAATAYIIYNVANTTSAVLALAPI